MKIDDILELAFSNYIDGSDYDRAEVMLFSIIRRAFIAGWKAAKKPPKLPKTSETSLALAGATKSAGESVAERTGDNNPPYAD